MDSIEIIIDIRKIVRSLNLESKSIQKDFGLNITQLMCLGHLENSPNYRSTHKELMKLLSTNSSTVTGIINRLEKQGFVARLPKAGDKRITYIALTASGLKLLQDTPNILHDRLSQKLEKLNDDEKKQVKKSLEIIISAMQIDKVEALPLLTVEEHLE
ncbi:MAG TPA: MarR family winged helix-turn-helix transcriptional regulator [Cyclobacteriaceae bacterium]